MEKQVAQYSNLYSWLFWLTVYGDNQLLSALGVALEDLLMSNDGSEKDRIGMTKQKKPLLPEPVCRRLGELILLNADKKTPNPSSSVPPPAPPPPSPPPVFSSNSFSDAQIGAILRVGGAAHEIKSGVSQANTGHDFISGNAQSARSTKNPEVSTGPFAHPSARSLTPLT